VLEAMVLDIPDAVGSVTIYNSTPKHPYRVVLTSRDFRVQVGEESHSIAEAYRKAISAFNKEKSE
jgi:hypothetical protein